MMKSPLIHFRVLSHFIAIIICTAACKSKEFNTWQTQYKIALYADDVWLFVKQPPFMFLTRNFVILLLHIVILYSVFI